LAGKKIMAPSGAGFSGRIIFARLDIDAAFDVQTDDMPALQKVIDGQADAWIVSAGKSFPVASSIANADGRLHLVSIPYDRRLSDLYLPSKLRSDEYPNLIPRGETVETLAASAILASFNWPENSERYAKVAKFTEAFLSKSAEFLKPPRNPKWRDMNVEAAVPGWTRLKAAQTWLDRNAFGQFIGDKGYRNDLNNLSQSERLKLFAEFSEWLSNRNARPEKVNLREVHETTPKQPVRIGHGLHDRAQFRAERAVEHDSVVGANRGDEVRGDPSCPVAEVTASRRGECLP
jgi:hypothetical protein